MQQIIQTFVKSTFLHSPKFSKLHDQRNKNFKRTLEETFLQKIKKLCKDLQRFHENFEITFVTLKKIYFKDVCLGSNSVGLKTLQTF